MEKESKHKRRADKVLPGGGKSLFSDDSSLFFAFSLILTALTCLLLPMKNVVMLRWYDEMSFFAPDLLPAMMHRPGGLLDYAGAFLTQFMFYPWLGSMMMLVLWILLSYVVFRAFKLNGAFMPLAFLPAFCLMVEVLSFDEAWISLKSPGCLFSPSLGVLVSVLASWGGILLSRRNVLVAVLYLALVACTYPLFGFYAVLAEGVCLISGIMTSFKEKNFKFAIPGIVGATLMAAVPYVYYYMWEGTVVDYHSLYIDGLPGFRIDIYDRYLWLPLFVMSGLLLVYSLVRGYKARSKGAWTFCATVYMLFGGYAFASGDNVSRQLRSVVAILRYVDHNQWQHVGYVMDHARCEPDLYMAIYDNMARQKLGLQMRQTNIPGDTLQPNPRKKGELLGTVFLSVPANYHLGKANSSYRWAMENTVAYGERIFYLKYMVRNALLNGEYKLAKKYNDRILGSIFHRYWAEHYNKYIENPESMAGSAEFNSISEYNPGVTFLEYGE